MCSVLPTNVLCISDGRTLPTYAPSSGMEMEFRNDLSLHALEQTLQGYQDEIGIRLLVTQ